MVDICNRHPEHEWPCPICTKMRSTRSYNSDSLPRQLDRPYHKKNLEIILRDLNNYTSDELSRALLRLAVVADPLVLSEQEFMQARISAAFADGMDNNNQRNEYFGIPLDDGLPTPDPTSTEYTAFCCQDDAVGSIWIECIGPFRPDDPIDFVIQTAKEHCAEAWGSFEEDGVTPDISNIHCLGLAAGDINILHWEDPA